MKAVLALAFFALARAAYIDKPYFEDALWHKTMDDMWKTHMLMDHTKHNPYIMDFDDATTNFKKFPVIGDEFYKPSLVFFEGPDGKMVSYYAHEGIDNIKYIPHVKSAFTNLYDAADKVAVHFRPEDIIGDKYVKALPGHFFQPENSFELSRFMHDMPVTHDFSYFKFPGKVASPYAKNFDFDALPFFYKDPVALDMTRFLGDASVVPISSVSPVVPFAKSGFVPMEYSSMTPYMRSGLTPAFHLVKADYPFFTAAPATTGLTNHLVKTASPFYTGYAPLHASSIFSDHASTSPLVKAVPVSDISSLGGSHFRSAIPATFGAHHAMNYAPFVKTIPLTSSVLPVTSAFSPVHSYIPLNY